MFARHQCWRFNLKEIGPCLTSQVVFLFDPFRVQLHVTIQYYTWLCDHEIMINTVQYSQGHLHVFNVFAYLIKITVLDNFHPFKLVFVNHVLILKLTSWENFFKNQAICFWQSPP